jgi:osmotically inducible protein OsmC
MPEKILYTAEAVSTGAGRNGHVTTPDGRLDLDMRFPKELGGDGQGANPELLFAAGYAACFHSALQGVARNAKADITGSTVTARVGIGPEDGGAFGLEVTLVVGLPNVPAAEAAVLAQSAHQVCPYSRATRGNITVNVELA